MTQLSLGLGPVPGAYHLSPQGFDAIRQRGTELRAVVAARRTERVLRELFASFARGDHIGPQQIGGF